jgi:hypothetical protein
MCEPEVKKKINPAVRHGKEWGANLKAYLKSKVNHEKVCQMVEDVNKTDEKKVKP